MITTDLMVKLHKKEHPGQCITTIQIWLDCFYKTDSKIALAPLERANFQAFTSKNIIKIVINA